MANAIFVRPLPFAAVTASSTASGHSPDYVGNDFLGVVWKSAASGATQSIEIDLGADMAFDTVALFGLTGALSGWAWQIDAAPAAGSYATIAASAPLLAGSVAPISGRGKALWVAASAPTPARYIRIFFRSLSSAAVTVGRVVIGQRIALARNFQFGAAFGVRELGRVDFSRRGVMLRQRGAKQRSIGISFPHVHREEVEAVVHPLLERIGGTEPVMLVTDPDANAQRQNRMYFGPLIGEIGTVWARANGFEWRANLTALDI